MCGFGNRTSLTNWIAISMRSDKFGFQIQLWNTMRIVFTETCLTKLFLHCCLDNRKCCYCCNTIAKQKKTKWTLCWNWIYLIVENDHELTFDLRERKTKEKKTISHKRINSIFAGCFKCIDWKKWDRVFKYTKNTTFECDFILFSDKNYNLDSCLAVLFCNSSVVCRVVLQNYVPIECTICIIIQTNVGIVSL